jgi:hypothetical protein
MGTTAALRHQENCADFSACLFDWRNPRAVEEGWRLFLQPHHEIGTDASIKSTRSNVRIHLGYVHLHAHILSGDLCREEMEMPRQTGPVGLAALLTTAALGLTACGGGGSGGSGGMGQMSLSVGDAPVDGAQAVVVKFTGVELTGNSGSPVDITFPAPKSIDLLNQSGTASAVLFDQPIPAGSYGQVRLMVVADGDPSNSYIILSDGTMHGLQVPSGAETGLKLVSGFAVPSSGVVDYTIDFDLRQALTCPPGQSPACILKPVERLVDNTTVGNIQGVVSNVLVPMGCTPGVYLYNGTVTAPEDINSTAPAGDANQPISSKVPVANSTPPYYYQFTFLPPGSYTVAFTCQAAMDNPDQHDAAVTFKPVETGISVVANQTTTVDIP